MRKIFILLTIYCGIFCLVNVFSEGPGSSSGTTLLQPISPKAAGLAEACASLSGDLTVMNYNPAGLASFRGTQITASHHKGLADDNLSAVYIGQSLGSTVLTTGIVYYTTGNLELYDSTGVLKKKTGQRDALFILGSGDSFKNVSIGINLKFLTTTIFGVSTFAFASDLGTQYKFSNKVTAGISLQNLGTKLKYISVKENLPLIIRPAISWRYTDSGKKITVSSDIPYYCYEQEAMLLVGVDASFENQLFLRIGSRTNLTNPKNSDENFNIGWGLNYKKFQFNHSVGITNKLSIPQRISITCKL